MYIYIYMYTDVYILYVIYNIYIDIYIYLIYIMYIQNEIIMIITKTKIQNSNSLKTIY